MDTNQIPTQTVDQPQSSGLAAIASAIADRWLLYTLISGFFFVLIVLGRRNKLDPLVRAIAAMINAVANVVNALAGAIETWTKDASHRRKMRTNSHRRQAVLNHANLIKKKNITADELNLVETAERIGNSLEGPDLGSGDPTPPPGHPPSAQEPPNSRVTKISEYSTGKRRHTAISKPDDQQQPNEPAS